MIIGQIKVRSQCIVDSKADMLMFVHAERPLLEMPHRFCCRGNYRTKCKDIRAYTVIRKSRPLPGWQA